MRTIKGIVIHHSLTKDTGTVSWGAIEDYHVKTLGWRDIGYHYGCERVLDATGVQRNYVMVGRPETMVAAGEPNRGSNQWGIHVCIVGNFDVVAPSDEGLKLLCRRLLYPIMDRYGLTADDVYGHHELDRPDKSCPGTMFDMNALRNMLR